MPPSSASGDAGGAEGAALAAWHSALGEPGQTAGNGRDQMSGAYLRPEFSDEEIQE